MSATRYDWRLMISVWILASVLYFGISIPMYAVTRDQEVFNSLVLIWIGYTTITWALIIRDIRATRR